MTNPPMNLNLHTTPSINPPSQQISASCNSCHQAATFPLTDDQELHTIKHQCGYGFLLDARRP